jgi:hypothetical protein
VTAPRFLLTTIGLSIVVTDMFVVTEADATAMRDIVEQEGELPAAIELRVDELAIGAA